MENSISINATTQNLKHIISRNEVEEAKKQNIVKLPPKREIFYLFMLGIMLSFNNLLNWWNVGLEHGFREYCATIIVVGTAFMCMNGCVAEMISVLPFGGGTFGFVRMLLGPFTGFIVGWMESFACSIAYTTYGVMFFCDSVRYLAEWDKKWSPLLWFFMYISMLSIHCLGKHRFYFINAVIGVVAILLLLVYVIGSAPNMDLEENVVENYDQKFARGSFWNDRMAQLTVSTWFFLGIDLVPLSCNEVNEPRTAVPKAMMASSTTSIVLALVIVLAGSSQFPGTAALYMDEYYRPLNFGYSYLSGLGVKDSTIFILPGLYLWPATFLFASGKMLKALAQSKLMPDFLKSPCFVTGKDSNDHAIIAASVIGFTILLCTWFALGPHYFYLAIDILYNVGELCSFTAFISVLVSYILFKRIYSTHHCLRSKFTFPLGVPGACYGIFIFVLTFISSAFNFYGDFGMYWSIWGYVVCFAAGLGYYVLHVSGTQFYSQEEKDTLMAIYVVKSNRARRKERTSQKKKVGRPRASSTSTQISSISTRTTTSDTDTTSSDTSSHPSVVPLAIPSLLVAALNAFKQRIGRHGRIHTENTDVENNFPKIIRKKASLNNSSAVINLMESTAEVEEIRSLCRSLDDEGTIHKSGGISEQQLADFERGNSDWRTINHKEHGCCDLPPTSCCILTQARCADELSLSHTSRCYNIRDRIYTERGEIEDVESPS